MTPRIIAAAVVIFGAADSAAFAQQVVDVQVADTTRSQVRAFEHTLRGAIDVAAGEFNSKLKPFVPDGIQLVYQVAPIVNSVLDPEGSAMFHVLIPAIEPVDKMVYSLALRNQAQAATNAQRVGAMVTSPDPAVPAPAPPPDLDKEYASLIRLALIDAILDNAYTLPVPESQNLTIFADELIPGTVTLATPRSRTLMLRIKGADLLLLRQQKITRDEAKARILEYKY